MYFCRSCGQCNWITNDFFLEYAQIGGTELRYLNPVTGDIEDWGDSNTSATGDSEILCPHCESSDIDVNWDGSKESAIVTRNLYNEMKEENRKQFERKALFEQIKNSDWDLETNHIME